MPLPSRIRIGEAIDFESNGDQRSGVVVNAFVVEQQREIVAMVQCGADSLLVKRPISDVELAIYRSSPDTFFGVVKPVNKPLTKPLECFDFFAQTYMSAQKETLLDWMKDHPDIEALRQKSQREVAEAYCDRLAASAWHQGQ